MLRRTATACLLAALSCLLLVPGPTPGARAQDGDARYDRIEREVARIRGLPFKSDLEASYRTRAELRTELERQLAEQLPRSEALKGERVLEAFGLAPEGLDLRKLNADLYTEQIAGFYDPRTKELALINSKRTLDPLTESIYSHEATHALQDQHHDLKALQDRLKRLDDDQTLAITSLIEGDATAVQFDYARTRPEVLRALLTGEAQEAPTDELEKAPPIIAAGLLYPYVGGLGFVTALKRNGGYRAVDRAFEDAPASTEQVLHPEKYLRRDEPTEVRLADVGPALGAGWRKLEENNLGEFQSAVLLSEERNWQALIQTLLLNPPAATTGWDGDRYALWTRGDEEALVWQSVWDSPKDAEEFAAALARREAKRLGAKPAAQGSTVTLAGRDRNALIERDGATVRYALAPDAELAARALAALGAQGGAQPPGLPDTGGGGAAALGPVAAALAAAALLCARGPRRRVQ
jgi:hypothetical protein